MEWVEALGLAASLAVFLSFLFNKEVVIRIVNIVGAILFVVYGILIDALSIWVVNGGLILVHLWKLFVAYRRYKNSTKKIVYNYQNKKMVTREAKKKK